MSFCLRVVCPLAISDLKLNIRHRLLTPLKAPPRAVSDPFALKRFFHTSGGLIFQLRKGFVKIFLP